MTPARLLGLLLGGCACCCAPRALPPPARATCPTDTIEVTASGRRVCVEALAVARGEYRACANATQRCERPPFRDAIAWGADHAAAPMPDVSLSGARAYCGWAGRRLPSLAEWTAFARTVQPGTALGSEWTEDAGQAGARRLDGGTRDPGRASQFRCVAAGGSPRFFS